MKKEDLIRIENNKFLKRLFSVSQLFEEGKISAEQAALLNILANFEEHGFDKDFDTYFQECIK